LVVKENKFQAVNFKIYSTFEVYSTTLLIIPVFRDMLLFL